MVKGKKSEKKSASKKLPNSLKNLNIKNKNYNLVKIKSSALNIVSICIVINIIVSIIMGYIVYYLNSLKSCDCFIKNNEQNKTNLDYLIIIQSIILAINIIFFIQFIRIYNEFDKIKSGGGKTSDVLISIIFSIINILIIGYFVYNVYLLSKNIDPSCECAHKSIRYVLYIQSIFMSIFILLTILGIFFILKK